MKNIIVSIFNPIKIENITFNAIFYDFLADYVLLYYK